jgi:hypothetical protein
MVSLQPTGNVLLKNTWEYSICFFDILLMRNKDALD